ncbi:MAG: hypothetical protein LBU16_00160 [Treponema sp.]|jgi:hypothetical protein|nr:hypothetical protein [Treponema sp.]
MMKRVLGFLAALLILSSCRPSVGGVSSPSSGYDFSRTFEDFWNGMNRNYVYWDREPTSLWDTVLAALPAETREFILAHPASFWDLMYDYYKPKFDELGVFADTFSPGYSDAAQKAEEYFRGITSGLVDGHFRVYFASGELFFPGQNRFLYNTLANDPAWANAVFASSDLSGTSVDFSDVDPGNPAGPTGYFAKYNFVDMVLKKYMTVIDSVTVGPEELPGMLAGPWKIAAGKIPHSGGGNGFIAYIFTNYCYFKDAFDSESLVSSVQSGRVGEVIDAFFDSLKDSGVKGVIVDVRGNMGGNPADNPFLFGRMIDSPLAFAYSRSKSGEGRLDYSPWTPVRIIPAPTTEKRLADTTIPIALLADRGTFSGAEFHAMIVKSMPNGRVIGENTNGSASNTVDSLAYNGGAFAMNSIISRVAGSVVQYKGADGSIYEGFGVPPDIEVPMSRSDWENFFGVNGAKIADKRLEEAIKRIDPETTLLPLP